MSSPVAIRPIAAILAAALALSAPAAFARSDADSTRARGVADTVTVLKPVEVRGTRITSSPERVSASTVHLDRGQVMRFAPKTVSDALVSVPGLNITRTGPWASSVSLRGLSGNRVAVLVDGVRMNTGRGHGAQTSFVSIDRLESVEVEPGSGSAINGSDAMGGTVEFITHRPLLSDDARAVFNLSAREAAPGNESAQYAQVRWLSPRFGFEFGGTSSRLQDLVVPDSTYAHSGYRDQDVTGRAVAKLGSVQLDYEHTAHRSFDIGLPAFSNLAGNFARYPLQSNEVDRLEVGTPGAGLWPGVKVLAVQQHQKDFYDETNVSPHFVRGRQVSTSTALNQSRVPFWSRSARPSLEFGHGQAFAEYRYETTTGPVRVDTSVVNMSGTTTYASTFADEAVPPARRAMLAFGAGGWVAPRGLRIESNLRWDHMRSATEQTAVSRLPATTRVDERLSGELGLAKAIGAWTPTLHVASNFRAPDLDERFARMIVHGGLFVLGNADLRPEHSWTTEVGVKSPEAFGGAIEGVRLSAYHTEATDLITFRYSEMVFGVPRFTYRNIRHAKLEGLEFVATMRAKSLRFDVTASAPRGWDAETREPITEVGATTSTFDARLPLPRFVPQGTFSTRARWTDAHRTSVGESVLARNAFWTLSAEAATTIAGVRWSLAMTNITNTLYTEPLSFSPMAGRTVTIAARRSLSLPVRAFSKGH